MIEFINNISDKWFGWEFAVAWQVGVLIAIIFVIDLLIRKWAWPQLRYALWMLVLVKLILPPTLTSPTSFTAEIPFLAQKAVKVQINEPEAAQDVVGVGEPVESVAVMGNESVPVYTETDAEIIVADTASGPIGKAAIVKASLSWKAYALFVWLAGIVILTTWLVLRLRGLRREYLNDDQQANLPERFGELLESVAKRLKLKKVPQVILTNKVCCPAVFGVFRPVLLMPADKLKNLTRQDAEHILLHELAHIKRGDLIIHAGYMILQIAYWFNPLIWLIRKQLQSLRELCCDVTVAKVLREQTYRYRETLLETAKQLLAEPADSGIGLLGLFENSNWLIERLKWLEKKTWKNRPLRIATIIVLVCLMITCVIPMTKFDPGEPEFIIKGRVEDAETGEPIAGAKVGDCKQYNDGKFFTVADSNGNYEYKTWYEEHNVNAEANGYKLQRKGFNTKLFGSEKEKTIGFALKKTSAFTLSLDGLMALDWDCSSWFSSGSKAKIVDKRLIADIGVEYDIYFPADCDPNTDWLFYGSSIYGGAGLLSGLRLADYESFDVKFTLKAINDSNDFGCVELPLRVGLFVSSVGRKREIYGTYLRSDHSEVASLHTQMDKISSLGILMAPPGRSAELDPELGLKITLLLESASKAKVVSPVEETLEISNKPEFSSDAKEFVVGRDYKKIQDAIDAAEFGDIVRVEPGVYKESVKLKSGINLIGEDVNTVIIQCDFREDAVLTIENCKRSYVGKMTLKHCSDIELDEDFIGRWPVVKVATSDVFLDNLVVCDSSCEGIRIESNGNVVINKCKVRDNRSSGIFVCGCGRVEFNNNICEDNKHNGIYLKCQASVALRGNLCRNNGHNGISVDDEVNVELVANRCEGNKWSGMWLGSNGAVKVRENVCNANEAIGITANGKIDVVIADNRCNRNGTHGIAFWQGAGGVARENTCVSNGWHGISIDDLSMPVVEGNNCIDNARCGVYIGMCGKAQICLNKIHNNGEFSVGEVQSLLMAKDFEELEYMASKIRAGKIQFSNGTWQLHYFYWSLGMEYSSWGQEKIEGIFKKWISQMPDSITARIGLANAYYNFGWDARGSGYSYTVSEKGRRECRKFLSKALEVLKDAEKLPTDDIELYTIWLQVERGLGVGPAETKSIFEKGISIVLNYYPLYLERATSYLERWYGDEGDLERFAQKAAELTKATEGEILYFLVSTKEIRKSTSVERFSSLGFDYDRLKRGQRDLLERFPDAKDNRFFNQSCFIACAAGNKEDAKDCFMDIGEYWDKNIWGDSETFEKYKSWARSRDDVIVRESTVSK